MVVDTLAATKPVDWTQPQRSCARTSSICRELAFVTSTFQADLKYLVELSITHPPSLTLSTGHYLLSILR